MRAAGADGEAAVARVPAGRQADAARHLAQRPFLLLLGLIYYYI